MQANARQKTHTNTHTHTMQRERINDQINEKSAPKWRLRPQWDSGSAAQWDAGSRKGKQKRRKKNTD